MKKTAMVPSTKTKLRMVAELIPADVTVQAILGLDGDCDFARHITDFYPYLCSRSDLLALIDAQSEEGIIQSAADNPEFLVLSRRHAVCLPDILRASDGALEQLWAALDDVPFDDGGPTQDMTLLEDWNGFQAGTGREEIWHWFDERHTKGVYYLLYEMPPVPSNMKGGR